MSAESQKPYRRPSSPLVGKIMQRDGVSRSTAQKRARAHRQAVKVRIGQSLKRRQLPVD